MQAVQCILELRVVILVGAPSYSNEKGGRGLLAA